ncbi:MAG: peptidylprolyl isomerase [Thermoanaerobaculia bacterium]|nr:peptidylprolyl isomerase [Thermoanaerobaculia bacterium]
MRRPPLLVLTALLAAAAPPSFAENPRVEIVVRDHGSIVVELFEQEAPLTVASFLEEVRAGWYEGTVFHRVIPGFMIQGGGFDASYQFKPTDKALRNEADNGLRNDRGTVAMARRPDPHTASVQFFVNLVDNDFLNHTAKTPRGWGYTVFGRVVEGMEVADAIAEVPTRRDRVSEATPVTPVVIERAVVLEPAEGEAPGD